MILITGATGHVGRDVVCRLASLGDDVAAMVRASKPQAMQLCKQGLVCCFSSFIPTCTSSDSSCVGLTRASISLRIDSYKEDGLPGQARQ
jgi:NAD dependent epimerase/dehydratase family enzyme